MKLQIKLNPWIEEIKNTKTFRVPETLFWQVVVFGIVFFIMQFAETCMMMPFLMPRILDWAHKRMEETGGMLDSDEMSEQITNIMMDPVNTNIMLFSTVAGTILVLLYIRIIEGRKLQTAGFRREHAVPHYLIGILAGFAAFSMTVGLAWLMGGLTFEGYRGQFTVGLILTFFAFLLQGMSEETLCRGFMMSGTLRHHNLWWAIGINSVLFGLMHAFNNGFSLLAAVNLILCGVLFSVYALRTGNLWGACAFHSIWNFAQGNFYGLPVSGIDSGDTIFSMQLAGSKLANGGDFGLEASLATTIVMALWIAVLLFVPNPFAKTTAETEVQV